MEKFELEEHFILRLPPDCAKFIRKVLRKKPKKLNKYLTLDFEANMRNCTVRVHKKLLNAKLVELPTIIESNKTIDGVQLFKTADISQMLICQKEIDHKRYELSNKNHIGKKSYQYPHGITPPLKNVRQYRFRKTLQNKDDLEEAANIEKEVLMLLRMDNAAVSTRFEIIYDEKPSVLDVPIEKISELSIFGDTLSDIDSDESSTTSEKNDIMDFTH